MGFWGKLLGGALGTVGGALGLGPLGGTVLGAAGSQIGEKYIPFAQGGRLMVNPTMQFRRGGKLRPLGRMPQMRIGGKVRKGSSAAKKKMAMLRAMKK
jgi:hypothetical protein